MEQTVYHPYYAIRFSAIIALKEAFRSSPTVLLNASAINYLLYASQYSFKGFPLNMFFTACAGEWRNMFG
ncbi:MAG: hypothetical protein HFG52_14075 [Lachnospiraceae bacterium]|nr:hypothetical protein [Lachnospiraceae bacterium]